MHYRYQLLPLSSEEDAWRIRSEVIEKYFQAIDAEEQDVAILHISRDVDNAERMPTSTWDGSCCQGLVSSGRRLHGNSDSIVVAATGSRRMRGGVVGFAMVANC